MKIRHLFIAVISLAFSMAVWADAKPNLLLAEKYAQNIDLSQYWLSEKYDGVRAYWDGEKLRSRQGNVFHAPTWFTDGLPTQALDGELWIGRGKFSATISAVSKNKPIDKQWRRVHYMIFELPNAKGTFTQRIEQIKRLVEQASLSHLKAVPQFRIINNPDVLQTRLDEMVAKGGEGLMLHRADALYHGGRSDDLLKVKSYEDAEALVIGHLPGKGKYTDMLGALVVETPQGLRFRIGTGFSDKERADPPTIGSHITYKYFGKTSKGTPRFASFLRLYMHQSSDAPGLR
jgi:DNA ligase-1